MPAEPTPEQWSQIEEHLYAGRKIAAIKALREATGCQLVDAKRTVERHEAALREQNPGRFAPAKAGCGAAAALLLGVGLSAAALAGWWAA